MVKMLQEYIFPLLYESKTEYTGSEKRTFTLILEWEEKKTNKQTNNQEWKKKEERR